jgi:hypothetical protein
MEVFTLHAKYMHIFDENKVYRKKIKISPEYKRLHQRIIWI